MPAGETTLTTASQFSDYLFMLVGYDQCPSGESFYGSPRKISLTKIADFETSSRPYLLKYGAPCHPDVIVR